MKNCLFCNKPTNNPKYCSRSCAAKHTNSLYPKRTCNRKCKTCGKKVSYRDTYCSKECKPISKVSGTIQDAMYKTHQRSSAYALIRTQARYIGKSLGFNKCSKCSYDKHYEVCHIKPISSFPLDTLISEVNSPDNLIPLCPNCHWEHDHNI